MRTERDSVCRQDMRYLAFFVGSVGVVIRTPTSNSCANSGWLLGPAPSLDDAKGTPPHTPPTEKEAASAPSVEDRPPRYLQPRAALLEKL